MFLSIFGRQYDQASTKKKVFEKAGYEITKIEKKKNIATSKSAKKQAEIYNQLVYEISQDPCRADLHLKLALEASNKGKPFLAYSELKTAASVEGYDGKINSNASAFLKALPDLKYMNHNQYFRFLTLANDIIVRAKGNSVSVLDVGGGEGELAAFLPNEYSYCLAEPTINGISGLRLPFQKNSFDFVVSCHVLEHIPPTDRDRFLDELMLMAKKGLVLLNPFHIAGTYERERLELVIDMTSAEWAKEHLDCTLPKISEVKDYAEKRGFQFHAKPNGTLTTSLAFVFLDHFVSKCNEHDSWKKINAFYNNCFADILDSSEHPTSYLVYLEKFE